MFTEPHKGSDGSCPVIFYCNHSWIVTFWDIITSGDAHVVTIHDPCNKPNKQNNVFTNMLSFSAGVTLVDRCGGCKFGDVIGQYKATACPKRMPIYDPKNKSFGHGDVQHKTWKRWKHFPLYIAKF